MSTKTTKSSKSGKRETSNTPSGDTLDCSDLDKYMGVPEPPARMKEEVHNNDIRRWVQAMHYPNLLHYDHDFAKEGRYGRLVAPQSFSVNFDDAHGARSASVGCIPGSALVFGGDEWWFYGPKIFGGDRITNHRTPYDYAVKETKFAGPTCFQRGDNDYYNQDGDLIARQRSTTIRYRADLAVQMGGVQAATEDPVWTDEELAALEAKKYEYIRMLHDLGHGRRYWDEVNVGDRLIERVFGPHSVASFATEWRAYLFTIWGSTHRPGIDIAAMGFIPEMVGHENDPVMERDNPELTDGAYFGPSRGHLFPRYGRMIGMPRCYGYGASMGAWIVDYLGGWAGEWGQVLHCNSQYRGSAFSGDATYLNAEITGKLEDAEGRHVVELKVNMTNQLGNTLATAKAEVALPKKGYPEPLDVRTKPADKPADTAKKEPPPKKSR